MKYQEQVLEFDEATMNIFSPSYSSTASHIKEKTSITGGVCIDVGSSYGYLGIEMAKITDMFVYLLDKSIYELNVTERRIESVGMSGRIQTLSGDVHNIPMQDQSVDLVISRESLWFWKDQIKAFKEIYRVLSPGGFAYVGVDFKNSNANKKVKQKKQIDGKKMKKLMKSNIVEKFVKVLIEANIKSFMVTQDELGLWVLFNKPHFN